MTLKRQTINRFDGGVSRDADVSNSNQYSKAINFDSWSFPSKISPFRILDEDNTGQDDPLQIKLSKHNGKLYSLTENGSGRVNIQEKSGANVITSDWTDSTNGEATGGDAGEPMFTEYNGAFYFWSDIVNGNIGRYDIDTPVVADVTNWNSATGVTATSQIQADGFVFSKNNTLYMPYDNRLASYDSVLDVYQATALLLPEEFVITSVNSWNDYVVIACRGLNPGTESRLFFWDTINADPVFTVDIFGSVKYVRNLGGEIGIVTTNSQANNIWRDEVLACYTYNGGDPVKQSELIGSGQASTPNVLDASCKVKNNQMYFISTFDGFDCIMRFGFVNGQYVLATDVKPLNGTPSQEDTIEWVGDYLYYVNSAIPTTVRTVTGSDASDYRAATYEKRFKTSDDFQESKLVEVSLTTEPLPTGASVAVSYDVDESGSFTSLFTHSTIGSDKTVFRGIASVPTFSTIDIQAVTSGFAEVKELSILMKDRPSKTTRN